MHGHGLGPGRGRGRGGWPGGPGGPFDPRHAHHAHAWWHVYHLRRMRRRGLQGQMFKAFGVAIALTALTVWGVVSVFGAGSWKRDAERAKTFVTRRFEQVWDDPARRAELTRSLAADMDLGVRTTGKDGQELERAGNLAKCHQRYKIDVRQGGHVEVCLDKHGFGAHAAWKGALMLLAPGLVLWMLAGLWSRRLARPLIELTEVARDLGEGRLERRARLRHGLSGEVGHLTTAMNDMAQRLEEKIRAERELLAGISHELRTPLARVRILTELGREGALGSRNVWNELEVEVGEMDALVGELLASARVDFRALSLRPLDAGELARQVLARHPGVELEVDGGGPAPSLSADATLVVRALGALLDNAKKHGGGARRLRVSASGGRVVFAVEDAGPGFAAADLPRVFEPFYRGAGLAHDEARGVGLGLALVRRIAEAHGGRAFAENLPGGARAGIDLPATGTASTKPSA